MRRLISKFVILSLALALLGFTAFNASADPIQFSGGISFAGDAVPWDRFTPKYNLVEAVMLKFPSDGSGASVIAVDGQYIGVPIGTSVTRNTIEYNPPLLPIDPLWTFTIADTTYSFTAESMVIFSQATNSLTLTGSGIAKITGFLDTPGTWIVTTNLANTTSSFSASTRAAAVPEPTSMLLLGLGLVGLSGFRRKFQD